MKGKDNRVRWVLAVADATCARSILSALPEDRIEVFVADTGDEALGLVRREMPEVLLADAVLPYWDCVELMKRVSETSIYTLPFVAVMAVSGMARIEGWAREAGACLFLEKPIDVPALVDAVSRLTAEARLPRRNGSTAHILRTLWSIGFSARALGTQYLAKAIELVSRDARLNENLTNVLYPMVADAFQVNRTSVAHAMRRAIESAWSGGSIEAQYKLFGNTIDARRGKPTSGEMIAGVAELLRTGMEMDE